MKKQNTTETPSERKDHIVHWRADDGLVKTLDEGKTIYGTRSEFIRRAVKSFRLAL